jgi:hypothetical protein
MHIPSDEEATVILQPKLQSVSATVLDEFFDELAKDDALADVASKLRKTILDDGVFAEPAIRAILFPDAA